MPPDKLPQTGKPPASHAYTFTLVTIMLVIVVFGTIALVMIRQVQTATIDDKTPEARVTANRASPILPATEAPLATAVPRESATLAPTSADCAGEWLSATWLDRDATTRLQPAFASIEGTIAVTVQVYGVGDACFTADAPTPAEFRPTQTDVTLLIQVEAAVLQPDENVDERLGGLTLRLVDTLPTQPFGVIQMVFTDGTRFRSLRFTPAQLARQFARDRSPAALIGALGGGH